MPQSRTERRAYDLIADGFGPGANGPLVIAVDVAGDPAVLPALAAAVAADPGIAEVSPPAGRLRTRTWPSWSPSRPPSPQSEATRETIDRLRSEVFPEALAGSPARAHVGGQVAVFADLGHRVQDRLPWFIAAVVLLSFLLLMVVFRSLLVPLKAAVMNLLSVSAAYGVLVMVFQWGWGGGPDRPRVDGADPVVHPAVHVRHPVRAVHGLRGLPPVAGPGGVRAHRRQRRGGRARPGRDRPHDHLGGADHGRGLRRLRPRRGPAGRR